MSHRQRVVMVWLAVQLVGFSGVAHAYLDPGTGSILVQSVLAGVVGALAVVSVYWHRLKAFFVNLRKSSRDAKPSATTTDHNAS